MLYACVCILPRIHMNTYIRKRLHTHDSQGFNLDHISNVTWSYHFEPVRSHCMMSGWSSCHPEKNISFRGIHSVRQPSLNLLHLLKFPLPLNSTGFQWSLYYVLFVGHSPKHKRLNGVQASSCVHFLTLTRNSRRWTTCLPLGLRLTDLLVYDEP